MADRSESAPDARDAPPARDHDSRKEKPKGLPPRHAAHGNARKKASDLGEKIVTFAGDNWVWLALGGVALLAYLLLRRAAQGAAGAVTAAANPLGTAAALPGPQGAPGPAGARGVRGPRGKAGVAGQPGISTGFVYRSLKGNSFAEIARAYGVSLAQLIQANPNLTYGASHPYAAIAPGTNVLVPRSRQSVIDLRNMRARHKAGKVPSPNTPAPHKARRYRPHLIPYAGTGGVR